MIPLCRKGNHHFHSKKVKEKLPCGTKKVWIVVTCCLCDYQSKREFERFWF